MNRTQVLNQVADILDARSYLEIGIFDPSMNFDLVRCPNKVGVDPHVDDSRVVRTTSDHFFAELASDRRWDLMFIDGDHQQAQVERDLANALRHLNPQGVIVLHDVNPEGAAAASPTKPSPSAIWSGEAWKVLVERVRTRDDLRCATVDCDYGVALVTRGHNPSILAKATDRAEASALPEAPALTYTWLQAHRAEALNLIPPEASAIRNFLGRASIVYYSSNQAKRSIRQACFERLRQSAPGQDLVVVAQEDEEFFASADQLEILGHREISLENLYFQMLRGLQQARYDTVFMAEDDVLYPAGYFDFQLPDRYRFFYNTHSYVANVDGYFATDCPLTSNGVGDRELLILAARQRLRFVRAGGTVRWTEPGIGDHDDFSHQLFRTPIPTVDIRHQRNLTGYRESTDYLDSIDPWGSHRELVEAIGLV